MANFRVLSGLTLLWMAVGCLSWSTWQWISREYEQAAKEDEFNALVENQTNPSYGGRQRERPTGPVGKLEIRRIGVAGFVEAGVDSRTLKNAIGMAMTSARPGEPGNLVLAAHRDTFFAGLRNAKQGDLVMLSTPDGKKHRYRISKMFVVNPSDNWVMNSSSKKRMLTLITCYPFGYVGKAPQRFIVQADPEDDVRKARPRTRRG